MEKQIESFIRKWFYIVIIVAICIIIFTLGYTTDTSSVSIWLESPLDSLTIKDLVLLICVHALLSK